MLVRDLIAALEAVEPGTEIVAVIDSPGGGGGGSGGIVPPPQPQDTRKPGTLVLGSGEGIPIAFIVVEGK